MTEVGTTKIALGDQVRVHFHPPYPMRSFCEGVVSRVDVTTPEGRFFAVEVRHEVILDREHRIRPGFQDYVRYECRNDFQDRIEVLSTATRDVARSLASDPIVGEPPEEPNDEEDEQHASEVDVQTEPEGELTASMETASEPTQVDVERQEPRRRGGLIGRLFGRQK